MKKNGNFIHYLLLTILLFLFWMVLTASLSLLNILLGIGCALLSVFFASRLLDAEYFADMTLPFILRFPRFSLWLFWEIIKANIDVAKIILDPRLPIDPRIFKLPVRLKGALPRSVYAASINLTPGTFVVEVGDDFFLIHGLAERHEAGTIGGGMEDVVARLFDQVLPPMESEVKIP